jgi:hypothetical protein
MNMTKNAASNDALAGSAKVAGLQGKTYLDKSDDPKNPTERTEDREAITFGEKLVDSVYRDAPDRVILEVGTGACSRCTAHACFLWRQ